MSQASLNQPPTGNQPPGGNPPLGKPESVNVETLREQLRELSLTHAAELVGQELSEAVKHQRSLPLVLHRLLSEELRVREEKRIKASLRLSGLPPGMSLANFDFSFQPSIERSQLETLATCSFITEGINWLLLGPPGVGKTHLVSGVAVCAIEHGFKVGFYRLEELLHELRKDADLPIARLKRKKPFKVDYLIIDEVGYEPMSRTDASLLFRLISYRYKKASTAITTNKAIKEWPELFAGDESLTMAILDRLLDRSVVMNIRGRSYRLKELEKLLK